MNGSTNRSDLIPSIIIEDYSGSQTSRIHSGEQTPVSSHFGSIASDEQSVTSSHGSKHQKSHLSGRRLRSRLKALIRYKSDKQQQREQKEQQYDRTNKKVLEILVILELILRLTLLLVIIQINKY
ncbi:unnamed protein product [Heterobilharzia americana]|nr:unnamed protein product [Heterobilharzia americana]